MTEVNSGLKYQPVPKEVPLGFAEKLIHSYRGRIHFREAVEMAARTEGYDATNALIGVARVMAEAEVSPLPVLEKLVIRRAEV